MVSNGDADLHGDNQDGDGGSLPAHEALKIALDLLGMRPSDLLAMLQASASEGEAPVARSTVNRWLAGTSPVPAAVKLWLRDRMVLTCRDGMPIALPKPLVIGITGDGGTGKTPVALKLAHIARTFGLRSVYLDAVDDCFNTASLNAIASSGRAPLVVKSRDRLRETLARINLDAPHVTFVDTPVRSFMEGYKNNEVFEADLLEAADHFLVLSRTSGLGVTEAIKIAGPLQEAGADWRLVLQGTFPAVGLIADAMEAVRASDAKIAKLFMQAPSAYTTQSLMQALESDAEALLIQADTFALWHILDEILQVHGVSLEDSEVPNINPKGRFESVVQRLARQ